MTANSVNKGTKILLPISSTVAQCVLLDCEIVFLQAFGNQTVFVHLKYCNPLSPKSDQYIQFLLKIIIIIIIYIYIVQTSIWIYSVALHNIVKVKLC